MWETWVDPWRRGRLPTLVFWPGEFHGLYSPWGCKEWTWLSDFHFHLPHTCTLELEKQWAKGPRTHHIFRAFKVYQYLQQQLCIYLYDSNKCPSFSLDWNSTKGVVPQSKAYSECCKICQINQWTRLWDLITYLLLPTSNTLGRGFISKIFGKLQFSQIS